MSIAVCIDFENRYEIRNVSEDLRTGFFIAELINGSSIPLYFRVSKEPHPLMRHVYNLAFGPPGKNGRINDKAQLEYKDYSRVFSTILFHSYEYLAAYKGHYIGIDGSTNSRARLYHMFIRRNYDYLQEYFNIYGLKYYVRITRFSKQQYDNPFDFGDLHFYPERIKKEGRSPLGEMYNYLIFNRK